MSEHLTADEKLAWAVLDQMELDCKAFEAERAYTVQGKADSVYRNAADALHCLFDRPVMVDYWCTVVDVPLKRFQDYIKQTYPKTCKEMMI